VINAAVLAFETTKNDSWIDKASGSVCVLYNVILFAVLDVMEGERKVSEHLTFLILFRRKCSWGDYNLQTTARNVL